MCPDFYAGAVPKTGTCRFTLNCAAGLLNMTAEIKKLITFLFQFFTQSEKSMADTYNGVKKHHTGT